MRFITCPDCNGTAIEEQHNAYPVHPDTGTGIHPGIDYPPIVRLENVDTCWACNGHLVVRKQYGDHYKTATSAKQGVARGTARPCSYCRETGKMQRVIEHRRCYTCKDEAQTSSTGVVPIWRGGDVLPDTVQRCNNMVPACSEVFAADVNIVVRRTADGMTWGESFLGVGTVYSCTDYGAMFERADSVIESMVREHLRTDRTQWIKVMDRQTRALATHLVVLVKPNGYTVTAADVAQAPLAGLPPTYTQAVLDQPV